MWQRNNTNTNTNTNATKVKIQLIGLVLLWIVSCIATFWFIWCCKDLVKDLIGVHNSMYTYNKIGGLPGLTLGECISCDINMQRSRFWCGVQCTLHSILIFCVTDFGFKKTQINITQFIKEAM